MKFILPINIKMSKYVSISILSSRINFLFPTQLQWAWKKVLQPSGPECHFLFSEVASPWGLWLHKFLYVSFRAAVSIRKDELFNEIIDMFRAWKLSFLKATAKAEGRPRNLATKPLDCLKQNKQFSSQYQNFRWDFKPMSCLHMTLHVVVDRK